MDIYLDNAATTKPCETAVNAVVDIMKNEYGNPSSLHRKGFLAERIMTSAKEAIATKLGCNKQEIFFTSGATESNNMAILGSVQINKRAGKRIIISAIEHPSIIESATYLETQGFEIIKVEPKNPTGYTVEDFTDNINNETILVSCMHVNNETGMILPIFDIAKAVKRINPKIVVHCDAVQSFMKLPIKLKSSEIDILSFSGHKISAVKGIGGLYIKKGIRLAPLVFGGMQQNGIRAGTEAVPLIGALGETVKANSDSQQSNCEHYQSLCMYLKKQLLSIPQITINSNEGHAPHILNFSVKGIRSEIMLHFLEEFEIYVSSGSACSKGKKNYVLASLGKSAELCDTAIRVSFCEDTTFDMLDILVQKLQEGIERLAKTK